MGNVFRARDPRLGREVAIKVLPDEVEGADRLRRFEREARAAGALNHPNVLAVFDIGTHDGRPYVVTELLEGDTLRARMGGGALPVRKAVEYGVHIARGLAAAHDKGIVHRDLKPENLFVARDGLVKILDFGLAKVGPPEGGSEETTSAALTDPGTVMGSVGYMSPEQVRGLEVDHGSDIFSFGVVLYEMLSGRRPFRGDTRADTMSAILKEEPPRLSTPGQQIPPALERVVRRCLEKRPEERFGSSQELKAVLESLSAPSRVGAPEAVADRGPRGRRRRRSWTLGLGAAGVALVSASAFLLRPAPPRITGTRQLTNTGAKLGEHLATDGSRIYFTILSPGGGSTLAQVSIAGGEPTSLPAPCADPWVQDIARDGSELLLSCRAGEGVGLWTVSLPGGSKRRLGDLPSRFEGAKWSPDGEQMAYVKDRALWLASRDGSDPRELVSPPGYPELPHWSPDGSRLAFTLHSEDRSSSPWAVAADGSDLQPLLPGWSDPPRERRSVWMPDGRHYLFLARERGLWALPEERGLLRWGSGRGEPVRLTPPGPMRFGQPTPSRDGRQIFVRGTQARFELVRRDRESGRLVPFLPGISAIDVAFSRDGEWVAYVSYPDLLLWRSRVDGSERLQLTTPPRIAFGPRWSPDGARIAFAGSTPETGTLWRQQIHLVPAGGGELERVLPEEGPVKKTLQLAPSWSPDGGALLFGDDAPLYGDGRPIRLLDLRTREVSTLPGSEGLLLPVWSPDGRYVKAHSPSPDGPRLLLFDRETERWEKLNEGTELVRLCAWSRDGSYLYCDTTDADGPGVSRLRIADRKWERVADLGGIRRGFPWWGGGWPWFGLDPEDAILLTRDAGIEEIYALDFEAP